MSAARSFLMVLVVSLALFLGAAPAEAATLGTACSVDGRTVKSSNAAEGLMVCNGSTWGSVTSGLTPSQAAALNAMTSLNTAGTACAAGERFSSDASGNVLVCLGGTWQVGSGGGSGGSSPTPFTFTDQTGVVFNTLTCSNGVVLAGMDTPAYVSVSKTGTGSPYVKINGSGTASQTYATVQSGDSVQVCVTSANSNLASITTPITVGGYRTNWTVTTGNKIPNAYVMAAPSPNPPPSVSWAVDSTSTAALTGLTLPSPVTVSVDGGASVTALNIGGGGWTAYTGSQTITNNQSLGVRITTSNTPSQVHNVTVSVGTGVPGATPRTYAYTVTNPVQDTTPDAFAFVSYGNVQPTSRGGCGGNISSMVTITGITGSVPVSVTGAAGATLSINGGAAVTSGSIQNGQTLTVQRTWPANNGESYTQTVTVGTIQATWSMSATSGLQRVDYSGGGSNQTFTVPKACKIWYAAWGGGQSGASGMYSYGCGPGWGAGCGGGGSPLIMGSQTVTPGQQIALYIGRGGAAPPGDGNQVRNCGDRTQLLGAAVDACSGASGPYTCVGNCTGPDNANYTSGGSGGYGQGDCGGPSAASGGTGGWSNTGGSPGNGGNGPAAGSAGEGGTMGGGGGGGPGGGGGGGRGCVSGSAGGRGGDGYAVLWY